MFYDLGAACAEATAGAEGACEGADDHVDVDRVDVRVFGEAAGGAAEDAKGKGFVEDEAELVFLFEVDLLREIEDQFKNGMAGDLKWDFVGGKKNVRLEADRAYRPRSQTSLQ